MKRRDMLRRSVTCVDRILCGAGPGHFPVQAPIRYGLVNLKTAKALVLIAADKVIE